MKADPQLKQHTFEYGFRPVYYFSRAVGLWPFSIHRNSSGTIQSARISALDGVWFSISMFIHVLAMYTFLKIMLDLESTNSKDKTIFAFAMLYALFRILCLLIGAIGTVLDMVNRRKLTNILRKLIIFDKEVGSN